MKNKKEFFGVLLSVLVSVFLVFLAVYATTTVGDDISVGSGMRIGSGSSVGHITTVLQDDSLFIEGVLEVDGAAWFDSTVGIGITVPSTEFSLIGTASISQDLWASGSFQFGGGEGTATASYSRLGGTATGHSLSNANDLVVNGSLEVDGTAYFDGNVSLSDSSTLYTTNIVGVRDTDLYLRIGDEALTSHSLAADDDLLVNGKLEVDGTAYFDGLVSASDANGIQIGGGATITIVAASPSCTSCVVGSLFIDTTNATVHICDAANTCSLITVQ